MVRTLSSPATTYSQDASIMQFSVTRYQRMIESGILTPEDKVELLENCVVLKMPRNPLHDATIEIVSDALARRLPPDWRLRSQMSIELADSQPEPDIAILRGDVRSHLARRPIPSDLGLLVEVADSSLLRDQRDKTRIYARAAIAYYWIVNLVDMRIEVYSQSSGATEYPSYQAVQFYHAGEMIPLILDGATVATIPVSELLP